MILFVTDQLKLPEKLITPEIQTFQNKLQPTLTCYVVVFV